MFIPKSEKESSGEKHVELKEKFTSMLNEARGNVTGEEMAMLDLFLSSERHMSIAEFTELSRQKIPNLDKTNCRKFLALLVDHGIARQGYLNGDLRYEHYHLDEHHDHLICLKCGGIETFLDDEIESRQDQSANMRGFSPLFHCLEIHGICAKCRDEMPKTLVLTKAFEGETLVVRNVTGGHELVRHLMAMGIIIGTELKVAHAHGRVLVLVRDTRIALDWKMAGKIEVERVLPPFIDEG